MLQPHLNGWRPVGVVLFGALLWIGWTGMAGLYDLVVDIGGPLLDAALAARAAAKPGEAP